MIGNSEEAPGTEFVILPVVNGLAEKESFNLSGEHLFEGNLSEVREEQSNIMQNEAEIIEGFMTAMDKTQIQSITATTSSPTLEDDEVPLNLVFSTKPRSSFKSSSKSKKGIKRGLVTHGKVKKSMEEILQDNRLNTLKRRILLRTTVFEDE
ncbi:hypothetical protein HAX54_008274, partial [Datura stramonium]|nr:hypothetical protein [Datura stramonium]